MPFLHSGLDQALQGRAAGLTVIANGAPGYSSTLRVRGISTVNDAIRCMLLMALLQQPFSNISTADIESIWKYWRRFPRAAIYGSLDQNGVIYGYYQER